MLGGLKPSPSGDGFSTLSGSPRQPECAADSGDPTPLVRFWLRTLAVGPRRVGGASGGPGSPIPLARPLLRVPGCRSMNGGRPPGGALVGFSPPRVGYFQPSCARNRTFSPLP